MPSLTPVPDVKDAPAGDRADAAPATALAAAVTLALSATTIVLAHVDDRRGSDYQLHTLLFGSDLALLVLVFVAGRGLPEAVRSWRRHSCALAGLAVGLSMVPALLVHPSDRGVSALLRWAAAVALALGVGAARRDGRRLVVGVLAVVTLAHLTVALAQRLKGGPLGLGSLGEPSAYVIAGRYASTGLFVHPYVLAAWCTVAGTGLLVLGRSQGAAGGLATIAGIVAFAGVGLSLSRAAALAGTSALVALAVWGRRTADGTWKPVAAAGVALLLGAALNLSGWLSRAGSSTTGNVDSLSSGRSDLLRQAWRLLGDHPVTGVGPGRYVLALSERPGLVALSSQSPRPVHVTPFLLVVEGGLLVVPALLLLTVALGRACRRGGAPAVAVTLAMLPFLALDHLAWSFPQGLVLTGLWLGLLDLLGQRDPEGEDARAATTGAPSTTQASTQVTSSPGAPA